MGGRGSYSIKIFGGGLKKNHLVRDKNWGFNKFQPCQLNRSELQKPQLFLRFQKPNKKRHNMSKEEEEDNRNKDNNPWQQQNRAYQDKDGDMKLWGIVVFGLIGATITTFAVSLFVNLRIACISKLLVFRFLSMIVSYRLVGF